VRVAGAGLAAATSPRTGLAVAWAIHLTWPHAVTSHMTAARVHGFPLSGSVQAHASLPRKTGRSATITTWAFRVEAPDVWEVDAAVRLTSPRRTAVDCLAGLPEPIAGGLLAWLVTRGVTTRDDLERGVERYRRRPGAAQLRLWLDVTRAGALSSAEELCHETLNRFGIRGWTANVPITDSLGVICVGDVVFEAERLVLEVDGWSAHRDREAFERDRRKQTRLAAAGWLVVRVTWTELTTNSAAFAGLLRQALGRRTAAPESRLRPQNVGL
jgi:hypothetical protein